MKTNISLAKKWILSATSVINRILRDLETNDFADIAFTLDDLILLKNLKEELAKWI